MSKDIEFKYTFPVAKAVEQDGDLFLIGEATGPEPDLQDDRIAPSLIEDFSRQIRDAFQSGNPIEFTEIHQEDGVLRELGVVVDGWVKPNQHLGVLVRLDRDNPASVYLHKSIKDRRKQVGMSIYGQVPAGGFKVEYDPTFGKALRTFYNVKLTSIGRTTRPVWTHSLGTVLAKAVDESAAAMGDKSDMSKNQDAPKAPHADENEEGRSAEPVRPEGQGDSVPEDEPKTEEERAEKVDTTTAQDSGVTGDEERADKHANLLRQEAEAPTGLTNEEIAAKAMPPVDRVKVAKIHQLFTLMQEFNLIEDEPAPVEQPVVEKSLTGEGDIATVVRKAVEDATVELRTKLEQTESRLQEVLDNTPEGAAPELLQKSQVDEIEEFRREFDQLPPYQKLRLALELQRNSTES